MKESPADRYAREDRHNPEKRIRAEVLREVVHEYATRTPQNFADWLRAAEAGAVEER
jgi:hypothetical protein